MAVLETFATVAKRLGRTEYSQVAEKLILHAQSEEEVAYPTAILIGEYVRLKLKA